MSRRGPATPRRILVIALSGIGDVLCALPLMEGLRLSFPAAQIDAAVMWAGAKDLLALHPALNRVDQLNMLTASYWESLRFCLRLRRRSYDVSLNVYPQSRLAYRLVAWLVSAPQRLSHRYDNPSWLDRWFITHEIPHDYGRHVAENNLALLRLLDREPRRTGGDYGLTLPAGSQLNAERFLHANQLTGKVLLGLHAGSGTTKNLRLKRWPLEYYAELIRLLNANHPQIRILLLGGPDEVEENRQLERDVRLQTVVRVETPTILDAAAIISRCHFFVSVDSALMHLAAATKVPYQVVIASAAYTPNVAPYQRPFKLITAPKSPGIRYGFDGKGIQGRPEEIMSYMRSMRPEQVYQAMAEDLARLCGQSTVAH